MPMKKHIVLDLINYVEAHYKAQFWVRFIELADPWEESGASEYEILFNYTLKNFPRECVINKLEWLNESVGNREFNGYYEARHWYRRS